MQHQFGIAAQKTGCIGAKRQIFVDAFGAVAGNKGLGVGVGPQAFHAAQLSEAGTISPHKAGDGAKCKRIAALRLFRE